MAEKKAEIIVPVYNAEKYLAQCLDSLLGQGYGNYHVTLVDDRSPDGSAEIAAAYAAKYPEKIRLMTNEENIGQGRSRMKAVYETDAEYILFVDSDDYVAPDYVSTYMRESEGDYDLIIGGFTKDIGGGRQPLELAGSAYTRLL